MAKPILHGPFGSPYVRSAQICFEEKGVAYDFPEMSVSASKEPAHLARQPFGKVPAFEHDGFGLYETQAIVRYIDEAFPGPALQPADVHARARMNQVIGILDAYFFRDISGTIGFQRLIKPLRGMAPDEEAIEAALPKARIIVKEVARLLGDHRFMVGDAVTLADIMLAPHVIFLAYTPEASLLEPYPALIQWVSRMGARDSFKKTAPSFLQAKAA